MKAPVKFDEYYLIERVAVGGMAEVFKGVSYGAEGFEQLTAVKRVLPHIAEDKEFIEMFIDEAEIAAQLQHPNIGQVFHLGKSEGKYFIAMEFISGQDLRALYDQARERQEHLDLSWCVYIIREVCEALDYAHRKRDAQQRPLHLIHRDVSPQNILMSYDGAVKLIDFGIVKANGKVNQTQVGILKGKFSYMSPEQARGLQLDARSDLFALAIVLYELVTLERCFYGQSDFSTIERVRNLEFKPPRKVRREIPALLEKIILKGLARDPNERYQSAADFQEALSRYLNKFAPRFTRGQAQAHMQRIFGGEQVLEQRRLDEFRDYAAEHIPEASRRANAAGRGRFDPHLSAPRDESRPRFAQDGPRLSINPSNERPRDLKLKSRPPRGSLPMSSGPSLRLRLAILIVLGALAGGGAALFASAQMPRFGQLHINSNTFTQARFTIDGMGRHLEGVAPALISELSSGEYEVGVEAKGYLASRFAVTVEADQKTMLFTDNSGMTPIKSGGFRYIVSTPSGAEVKLDGRPMGKSPLTLFAQEGAHLLELSLKGYETLKQTVPFTSVPQELDPVILFPEQVTVNIIPSVPSAVVSLKSDRESPSSEWRAQGSGERALVFRNNGRAIIKVSASGYEDAYVIFPRYPQREVTEWVELNVPASARGSTSVSVKAEPVVVQEVERPRVTQAVRSPAPPESSTQAQPAAKRRAPKRKRPQKRRTAARRSVRRAPPPAPPPQEDRQPGFLRLVASPAAEVIYKGKSIGWTPLIDKKFPEGRHTFTLRLPDGEEHKVTYNIPAGHSVKMKWTRPR